MRRHAPFPNESKWAGYACALAELPSRLFPSAGVPGRRVAPVEAVAEEAAPAVPAPPLKHELLGHLAELEVMRLLGELATLNTFKAFPDVEEAEYLVRHRPTGNIRGVQVKCLIVPDEHFHGGVDFRGPSFRASALIDVVVLASRHDLDGFDERAWLIPAIDIPHRVSTSGYNFRLPLWVSADVPGRFDDYRVRRQEVAALLERRTAETVAL